jgi:outer membrane usher protein
VPGSVGVVSLGAAASTSDEGGGALALAGYEYVAPAFNFVARGTWANRDFRTPGDDALRPLQRLVFAGAGLNFGSRGTVGIAWADQQFRGFAGNSTTTLSYAVTLAPRWFLNASVSRTQGSVGQTAVFASLLYSFDGQTFAGADVASTRSGGSTSTALGATLQRSLPIGEGYGYRLRATTDEQYVAGGVYAGPYGRYSAEVARQFGQTAARGNVAGGVGTIGGSAFASRPIVDSFALVQVDGVPGVRVTQNGNFAGSTDDNGRLVITQLSPYMATRVTIDDRDLPIEVTLPARERQVAPYFRSGAIVDFAARRLANALVEVRLPDGTALPAGSLVQREGGKSSYPVGDGGLVFIDDFVGAAPYVAQWSGGRCRFVVDAPQADVMPRYGPVVCAMIAP